MVGRSLSSPKATMDDAVSYLTSVKKAFHDEPEKCREFLKVLHYIKAHRIDKDSGIARMTKLIKGHPKLLRGLNVFLPKAKIAIPPEANITKANKGLGQLQTIGYIRVSRELLMLNLPFYAASVKEAFHDQPAKHKEWLKILKDIKPRSTRDDKGSFVARVVELMKDHRNLLLGFSLFIPSWAKITIPPEAEKQNVPDHNNKRKCVGSNGVKSMNKKLKKRKIKGINACPSKTPKKKVEHSKRIIHCKKCGQAGHNSRSCGKQARQVRGSSGSQMESSQS